MSYITLQDYYRLNMMFKNVHTHHPFSIDELEMLYPFERQVYFELIKQYKETEELNARSSGY